jgi:SAF domain
MKPNALIINDRDNVAVVLEDVGKGGTVYLPGGRELEAVEDISFSHKIALRDITKGEDVIKYGEIIGQAGEAIRVGGWVHIHNLVIED